MIRNAIEKDIPKICDLLSQVCLVHHNGRPDIFNIGRKYSSTELKVILNDKSRPILVSVNEMDEVIGYCFCIFQQHINNSVLTDIKTLYIDDLCVDENMRGKHIGKELYEAAVKFAKENGCYNLTCLRVWGKRFFYNKSVLRCFYKTHPTGFLFRRVSFCNNAYFFFPRGNSLQRVNPNMSKPPIICGIVIPSFNQITLTKTATNGSM